GPKIVTDATKEAMRQAPRDIQTGRIRKELQYREPRRRADAAIAPPADLGAPDRAGRREAARDDAVDQGQPARRQVAQLSVEERVCSSEPWRHTFLVWRHTSPPLNASAPP